MAKSVQFTVEEKIEREIEMYENGDSFNDTLNMKSWRYNSKVFAI
jgi:hypothetical protein